MGKVRTAVLISGRGSNLGALLEAASAADYPACIDLVVSNVPGAGGLAIAERHGVATRVVDNRTFADRESFERALDDVLNEAGISLICLAGFMRLLTAGFVERWQDRILNIHPSLLPSFKGLDIHRRVLDSGVRIAGCTVHVVRPATDDGPIVVQAAVPVLPGDDEERLAARILKAEHHCYPLALRLIAGGHAAVHGDRVEITDPLPACEATAEDAMLVSAGMPEHASS